jgi:putative methionine-R-sulfoxide reductase with GAF domain
MTRPYDQIIPLLSGGTERPARKDRSQQMRAVVDKLWAALHPTGVSWIGFYLLQNGVELILGPRRDKPACSPIGLHGACGRALRERRALVVRDVRNLGTAYIACDPRDRSELVVPLFDPDGRGWGVLDLDSHEPDSFSVSDVDGLTMVLSAAGLTDPSKAAGAPIVV